MRLYFRLIVLFAVMGGAYPSATLYAAPQGQKVARVDAGFIDPSGLMASPDGRWLAVLTTPGEKGSDCTLVNLRMQTVETFRRGIRLEPVAFSPNGRWLVCWGYGGIVLQGMKTKPAEQFYLAVYDLKHRYFTRFICDAKHDLGVVTQGVFSRDGRTLTVLSVGGGLSVFDFRSGSLRMRRQTQSGILNTDGAMYMVNDDLIDMTNGPSSVTAVSLCSVHRSQTGKQISLQWFRSLAGGGGAFSPDGKTVLTSFRGAGRWVVWDTQHNKRLWKLAAADNKATMRFSPDGRYMGIASKNGFDLRDARTGKLLKHDAKPLPNMDGETVWTFASGGQHIYSADTDGTLWLWRVR